MFINLKYYENQGSWLKRKAMGAMNANKISTCYAGIRFNLMRKENIIEKILAIIDTSLFNITAKTPILAPQYSCLFCLFRKNRLCNIFQGMDLAYDYIPED
jgi:hypothetical protein